MPEGSQPVPGAGHDDLDPRSFTRNPGVLWRSLPSGGLLLAESTDEPVVVSSVGALIWELLEHEATIEEIAHLVASRLGADLGVVRRDVQPFMLTLVELGAVLQR